MEDRNTLAADCIVICTCGPCLLLQVAAFLLLKLPCRAMKKAKKFVVRKVMRRKHVGNMSTHHGCIGGGVMVVEELGEGGLSLSLSAIREAEMVMEELYACGELGFGVFGRRRVGDVVEVGCDGSVWEICGLEETINLVLPTS